MPALLTSTWTGPSAFAARASARSHCAASLTSQASPSAACPSPAAAASTAAASRSSSATPAPAAAAGGFAEAAADSDALLGLDPELSAELKVAGRAPWQVLAGAARTAGATAPLAQMVPLALLAMLGMVLPSVAGWGPREGATAWVFASAGLGAERGAATAVAYGVMVLVASLPGALALVAGWVPLRRRSLPTGRMPVVARPEGAADA